MSNNADQWLRDNGANTYPACAFEAIGATIVGRVIDTPRVVTTTMDGAQQESYVIGVEVLDNTNINIGKAGERRPAAVGDEAAIWVKRGGMANALQAAVFNAGAQGVAVGGTIAIRYTGDGQRSPGKSPPKQYQCQYAPPVAQVSVADLFPTTPNTSPPMMQPAQPSAPWNPLTSSAPEPAPQPVQLF